MSTLAVSINPSVAHTEVRNNPLNTSTAKMQYSFPRGERFASQSRILIDIPFYDIPTMMQKRATTFGLGTKLTFQDSRTIPASNIYTIASEFSPDKGKKRGFSFGLSREVQNSSFRKPNLTSSRAATLQVQAHIIRRRSR